MIPGRRALARSLRGMWPFVRRFLRHRRKLLAGFVCIPLSQLADIAVTLSIGDALNRLERGDPADFLGRVFALVLAYAAAHAVLRFFSRWWLVSSSHRFERELKQELFEKLGDLPLAFHERSRSGDVVSRITSDVEALRSFLGPGLLYAIGAFVILPVGLGVLVTIEPRVTFAMIFPLVVMAVFMRRLGPRMYAASRTVQESQAELSARAQDDFGGIRIVKGYAREREETRRFAECSQKNRANQLELGHVRALTHTAVRGSFAVTFAVLVGLGAYAMIAGRMQVGDLFKFLDLTLKMFWPMIALGWIVGMYPRAAASAVRIDEILAREPDIADPEHPIVPPDARGALALEDVSFTHEGAARPALQHVSVQVPAGTTLGVVGPTGSGKTTLLSLLGRLREADGTVRVDGLQVQAWSLSELRALFGYVPQDGFLFSDTLRANVSFGLERALDDAELEDLLEAVRLSDEVRGFPGGLDQEIGERGITLSGGQRQRACIARALACAPRVLVLDDCLNAVDTETESRLLANLRRAGDGRTVVVAAHRLTTVEHAERILVLDADGRVADQGAHAELVARPGWYRDTWERQQRREELEVL